jgi:hypothetical protein
VTKLRDYADGESLGAVWDLTDVIDYAIEAEQGGPVYLYVEDGEVGVFRFTISACQADILSRAAAAGAYASHGGEV